MDIAQFVRSHKGHPQLLDNRGYTYFKTSDYTSKRNPNSVKTYWECVRRPRFHCPARAITEGGNIIKYVHEHIHVASDF